MIIYKTLNLKTGKFYIGKDKYNNPKYLGSGKLLHQAFNKYGIENFKKETICEAKTKEELNELEIFWIKELNTITPNGYNIAHGGEGGDTMSNNPNKEEIFRKHSEWMKEHTSWKNKRTPEQLQKMREISLRIFKNKENHPSFGKQLSQETKKKIGDANKGKKRTEEQRKRISEANMGKPGYWKGKINKKHSEWMKENNPFKGKTHTLEVRKKISEINKKPKSEEHKKKISESLKGHIPENRIEVKINGITYESINDASEKTGINYSTLRNRIKSDNPLYKNYERNR